MDKNILKLRGYIAGAAKTINESKLKGDTFSEEEIDKLIDSMSDLEKKIAQKLEASSAKKTVHS